MNTIYRINGLDADICDIILKYNSDMFIDSYTRNDIVDVVINPQCVLLIKDGNISINLHDRYKVTIKNTNYITLTIM